MAPNTLTTFSVSFSNFGELTELENNRKTSTPKWSCSFSFDRKINKKCKVKLLINIVLCITYSHGNSLCRYGLEWPLRRLLLCIHYLKGQKPNKQRQCYSLYCVRPQHDAQNKDPLLLPMLSTQRQARDISSSSINVSAQLSRHAAYMRHVYHSLSQASLLPSYFIYPGHAHSAAEDIQVGFFVWSGGFVFKQMVLFHVSLILLISSISFVIWWI